MSHRRANLPITLPRTRIKLAPHAMLAGHYIATVTRAERGFWPVGPQIGHGMGASTGAAVAAAVANVRALRRARRAGGAR